MSNIVTDKIKPDEASADKLTIGGTGDSVVVLDSLNLNQLQDTGGNNIFVSNGSGTVTSKNSGLSGALNLISTQTPSGVTTVGFTSGLDSTYDIYIFKFIDIHCVVNNGRLQFNGSTDGGSTYATTKTTTMFTAHHNENDALAALDYESGFDLAQSTADQPFMSNMTSEADGAMAGEFYIFAPSSTTYVKHFYSNVQWLARPSSTIRGSANTRVAGYFNTTSAVDAINFTMSSGNFSGTIKLYGISKS